MEWTHKARGYCCQCYPLIRNIESIQSWSANDLKAISDLRSIKRDLIIQTINRVGISRVQKELIKQIKIRLNLLKSYNAKIIDAKQIEIDFKNLAKTCNISENIYQGIVADFYSFNNKSKKIIHQNLVKLLLKRNFIFDPNVLLKLK